MNIIVNTPIDISIIVPLYKGQKFCSRIIELIQKNCAFQDLYKKCFVELIFINDYPEEEIIIKNKNHLFAIYVFVHEKNQGIHAARVTGLKNSNGKYIIMLDQDDLVKDNWLYCQWRKIEEKKADISFCNGWKNRFRILEEKDIFQKNIYEKDNYIKGYNPIVSPGQAIIKRDAIPNEWMNNIQKINGSDDFLLWIMMIKKKCHVFVNNEFLYYHSPERSIDSIAGDQMIESLKETARILYDTGFFSQEEKINFDEYIKAREESSKKEKEILIFDDSVNLQNNRKRLKIYFILRRWLNLKVRRIDCSSFFYKHHYKRIAIYGFGYIGENLYYELCNTNLSVSYAIDKSHNFLDFKQELSILNWENDFDNVDVVVVTLVENYDEIIKELKKRFCCPIITMKDLLLELENSVLSNL